jgi:uncharacterized membrane protein
MTSAYFWIKTVHIVSAAVLFGTGLGTAFHMWLAHRSGDLRAIATTARNVVLADYLFTLPAVAVQPASGAALIWFSGADPFAPWLILAYCLYFAAGLCWLPVIWLQIRVRDIARSALTSGQPLSSDYVRYKKIWFALGWPAFAAVLVTFWLMVAKPEF